MKNKSFSKRLSGRVILIVAIIFVVGLVVVGITSNNLIAEEAENSTRAILHGTISDFEMPLTEVEISTRTVAALMVTTTEVDIAEQIIQQTVALDSLICAGAVMVPTAEGPAVLYSYEDSNGTVRSFRQKGGWADDSWASRCMAAAQKYRRPFWAPPYMAEGDRRMLVTSYCLPMFRNEGGDSTLIGIVTSELPIEWMETRCENLKPYNNSMTTVVCGDKLVGITDTNIIAQIKQAIEQNEDLRALEEDLKKGKDSIRRFWSGSKLNFVVFGPLHNGWMVSITCPYKEVLMRSSKMHVNLIIIGILGIVLLYFVCRRTIKRMTRPITELSDAALQMAQGDFKASLPEIKSQDEMKHLRDSFIFMQNSITDYINELKTTTAANERMESELNVARNIQMGMLNRNYPDNLHAMLVPAKEVGGDLYDFVLRDRSLYFAVGDVSGKGVPASLMMAITRAALRFVASIDQPINTIVSRINNSVTDSNSNNMFVTLFVGRINLDNGHMEYCNAGHNPIIIIPPHSEPYFLKAKANLAIGIFEDFPYEAETIDIAPGTRIIAYTDGINEAERADKSLFGNQRLLDWASAPKARDRSLSEKDIVEDLYATVKEFVGDNPQNDDITILSFSL